jgi:hypothetical protein
MRQRGLVNHLHAEDYGYDANNSTEAIIVKCTD